MADLVMLVVRDKVIEVAKKALKMGMSASDVILANGSITTPTQITAP